MGARTVISIAALPMSASASPAQTPIRVVHDKTGDPIRDVRVVIEQPDKTLVEQGTTNAQGIFLAKNLVPPLTVVSISVYPPDGARVKGFAKDFRVDALAKGIEIRLRRRLLQ